MTLAIILMIIAAVAFILKKVYGLGETGAEAANEQKDAQKLEENAREINKFADKKVEIQEAANTEAAVLQDASADARALELQRLLNGGQLPESPTSPPATSVPSAGRSGLA